MAANRPSVGPPYALQLCCGFEPLHLITFLKAHLRGRLEDRGVEVTNGLFGDLVGNIERASAAPGPIVVVLEWADVDPRLDLREGVPTSTPEEELLRDAMQRLSQFVARISAAISEHRVVMALPATPLPPWLPGLPGQATAFALRLRAAVSEFAARCASCGVLVTDIPASETAYDFRSYLNTGFPYVTAYTDLLASDIAALLVPPVPKKGLITDLDNTFWTGIVGDDGPANVHWSLEHHARAHGLYQQFLAGLAAQGFLVAAASKNDPAPVAEALSRADLLMPASSIFPVEANWGPKIESVRRIVKAWNIGFDAVVFVDDDPVEIERVRQELPEIECFRFQPSDPAAVFTMIGELRRRFFRERITDEDRLRAESIRRASQQPVELEQGEMAGDQEAVLAGLEARVTCSFARSPWDARAFELLNKTNQFNINGKRWEEAELREFLKRPEAALCVVSYEDRFGALGKIAVALGTVERGELRLESWVMSCRAFSRRIEVVTLGALFEHFAVENITAVWRSTPRNGPSRDVLARFCSEIPEDGTLQLQRGVFHEKAPKTYAQLTVVP
jgi:FkbH-like protein